MKKTAIIALLCMLALLVACAPVAQPAAPAPVAAPSAPAAAPAPSVTSSPAIDYSMSTDTQNKVDAGIKGTTKWYLSENFVPLSVGQHHTFGVGFANRQNTKDNFLVDVSFKRAYDKSSNSIESATAAQVAGWLSQNDFGITALQPDGKSIQPVVIEVKNFADGSTPPRGTYVFALNVFHQGQYSQVNQPYSGALDLNIQVV
jgi:hypothetical protein